MANSSAEDRMRALERSNATLQVLVGELQGQVEKLTERLDNLARPPIVIETCGSEKDD